ncbi:MAG: hypothetical protein WAU21_10520 [Chitinophagales bacterium]|nr:hypothetical protein [Bacteroidota bacterium]
MNTPVIQFQIHSEISQEIAYTLQVFGRYIGFSCKFLNADSDVDDAVVIIAEHGACDIPLSHFFSKCYLSGDYAFKSYFKKGPLHYSSSGKPDYLSTCFYLLACIQEYADYKADRYHRFPFSESLQHTFNCVEKNLVADYFDLLYNNTKKINTQVSKQTIPSRVFLTHDIDTLYGALRENAKPLLRKGQIGKLLQLMMHHYFQTPDYMLFDKIMQLENAYDVKSTFFWLIHRNKYALRIPNADYVLEKKEVQQLLIAVKENDCVNGLHKSYSTKSYSNELQLLKDKAEPINRNHFLMMELPHTFNAIEEGGIQLDSTLAFAETPGWRNNFGLPFQPYNVKQRSAYNFTEVPLTIMDATFNHYMHLTPEASTEYIINFLENNRFNCVHTILWHNNYFFNYDVPGWLDTYKSILVWMKENNLQHIMPKEMIISK